MIVILGIFCEAIVVVSDCARNEHERESASKIEENVERRCTSDTIRTLKT